jgi:hypothetical protein
MSKTNFKFKVGQLVRFGATNQDWEVFSRHFPEYAEEPQYYLQSQTTPSYQQWVLESDLREAKNV